jgi:hypothetical protein
MMTPMPDRDLDAKRDGKTDRIGYVRFHRYRD